MYKTTEPILKAAEVLEKVAALFEQEEMQKQEKKAEEVQKNFIEPLKETLADMPKSLSEKLAHTDPEVLALLKDLSGQRRDMEDISLGGSSEKVASAEVEDSLLAFMMDQD